jgi:hypothetical protein
VSKAPNAAVAKYIALLRFIAFFPNRLSPNRANNSTGLWRLNKNRCSNFPWRAAPQGHDLFCHRAKSDAPSAQAVFCHMHVKAADYRASVPDCQGVDDADLVVVENNDFPNSVIAFGLQVKGGVRASVGWNGSFWKRGHEACDQNDGH